MIPILYESTEKAFTTNGLGRLAECTRCEVTEELNGKFELEFDLPITAKHYSEIAIGSIVSVIHDDTKNRQPFSVYRISKPINGLVTFYAHHISYRLAEVVLTPFAASTAAQALSNISSHCLPSNEFTFWTDKSSSGSFVIKEPKSCRAALGGSECSILDVFGGGEYKWDKFTVMLYEHRGNDNGVTIRYGKNLLDINDTTDTSTMYNAIVPYWSDDEEILMLPEILLYAPVLPTTQEPWTDHNDNPMTNHNGTAIHFAIGGVVAAPMDLSDKFETRPTVEQLRAAATSRFNSSQPWVPSRNIKVDFVSLAQTADYESFAVLQRVALGDTVTVIYPELGVEAQEKVVKTVYNVLTERFENIELGENAKTFAQQILEKADDKLGRLATKGYLDAAIEHATELITGGLGGHVVFTLNADGEPEEILIMDTDDVSTAVNVWRFNQGGLGHSHSGYNGPFSDIALTMDGRINASMITTGIINANLIRSGAIDADLITTGSINANLITSGAINASLITTGALNASLITTGTLNAARLKAGTIQGPSGTSYWNLETGGMSLEGDLKISAESMKVRITSVTYKALNLTTGAQTSYSTPGFKVETDAGSGIADSSDALLFYKNTTNNYANLFHVTERHMTQASDADYSFGATQTSRYMDTAFDRISKGSGLFDTYIHIYRHGAGFEDRCFRDEQSYTGGQLLGYIFRTSIGGMYYYAGKDNAYGAITVEAQQGKYNQSLSTIVPGLSGTYEGGSFRVVATGDDSESTPDRVVLGVLKDRFAVTGRRSGTTVQMLVVNSNATCVITNSSAKINGNTVAYQSTSSRRYKEDIRPIEDAALDPHRLYELEAKQFRYHEGMILQYSDMQGMTLPGFIAEEVAEIYPSAVIHDPETHEVESWDERRIIPGMLQLIQEQKKKIDELEERLARLEAMLLKEE